jgi:hypothetical protein
MTMKSTRSSMASVTSLLQLLQIQLDFLHRRQCALQVVWQGFHQGVFAHAHGFVHVAQGEFHLDVVLVAAQQQADGGLVVLALSRLSTADR